VFSVAVACSLKAFWVVSLVLSAGFSSGTGALDSRPRMMLVRICSIAVVISFARSRRCSAVSNDARDWSSDEGIVFVLEQIAAVAIQIQSWKGREAHEETVVFLGESIM